MLETLEEQNIELQKWSKVREQEIKDHEREMAGITYEALHLLLNKINSGKYTGGIMPTMLPNLRMMIDQASVALGRESMYHPDDVEEWKLLLEPTKGQANDH